MEPVRRARSQPGDPENWRRNSRKMQRGKPGQSNCYSWVNRIKIAHNAFPLRGCLALELRFSAVNFSPLTILFEDNSVICV